MTLDERREWFIEKTGELPEQVFINEWEDWREILMSWDMNDQ